MEGPMLNAKVSRLLLELLLLWLYICISVADKKAGILQMLADFSYKRAITKPSYFWNFLIIFFWRCQQQERHTWPLHEPNVFFFCAVELHELNFELSGFQYRI